MAPRPEPIPFREAIDFLKGKIRLPTRAWTDIREGQHARAFVVAGAIKDQLVADFHDAVARALEQGRTLDDFKRDFDSIVARHGWTYKGGRGWRSAVIYNTNLRTARAAGQWAQILRLKDVRPWLRYEAVLDSKTRPIHRQWHGTILRWDDPWWQTNYPPNGWNCRCTVVTLSDRDLEAQGWTPSPKAPPLALEARTLNTPEGPETVQVPEGVDTGFGYNVGEAAWGRGPERVALERHGAWKTLEVPAALAEPLAPLEAVTPLAKLGPRARPGVAEDLRRVFQEAVGGLDRIFTDPTGTRVLVGQAIIDHMLELALRQDGREAYFPFLPELVEKPQEIWIGFARSAASGRVGLRRRYVRLLDLGQGKLLGLVADVDQGMVSGTTFFRGEKRYLATLRSGIRIFPGK